MKNIILLLIVLGGYQYWHSMPQTTTAVKPLYERPYVVVYGRDSCGFTQRTLQGLKKSGIPYKYEIVDQQSVADLLHNHMRQAGIDTHRYNLPVVDVSSHFSVRPEISNIIEAYSKY